MKFRDLSVGQWFDFVEDGSIYNSFYCRCQKVAARHYRWRNTIRCSLSPQKWLMTRVGSINVDVYHAGRKTKVKA